MNLPWAPIIFIDTGGSVITLLLATTTCFLAYIWYRENPEDNFRNYIFLFTLSIVLFAVSRCFGHIIKQILVYLDLTPIWKKISPFSGAINSASFIIIFAFSIYFRRFHTAQNKINDYRDHLEDMVADRTNKLNEHIKFQQQLIDSIPSPIYFKDLAGKFIGCNKAFAELTDFDMQEIVGKSEYDLSPHEIADKYHKIDIDLIQSNKKISFEGNISYAGTSGRQAIFHKAPFADTTGKAAGMIGTFVDITERQNMERRLRYNQKMETISTLAGGIAHDFNNILAAIMGFSELAVEKMPTDSPEASDIKQVIKAAVRAKDLVRQILSFSRQDKKQRVPIKIYPLIDGIKRILEPTLPANIEIKTDYTHEQGVVVTDRSQMHLALLNICHNAVQAMEDDGGIILISINDATEKDCIGSTLPAGNYVKITIRDTGSGIDETLIERIFEPFFTTKKFGKGTGMGLSVAHGIIENIGGTIEVSSKIGKGSEFIIFLPINTEYRESLPHKDFEPPGGKERILFVDDERILVDMCIDIITRFGYQVEGCTSSLEALDKITKHPAEYDLLITDQIMPNMTGTELAVATKKINAALPVIICSGFSATEIDTLNLDQNIKAFVSKPILTNEFAVKIRKVLDGIKVDD